MLRCVMAAPHVYVKASELKLWQHDVTGELPADFTRCDLASVQLDSDIGAVEVHPREKLVYHLDKIIYLQ